MDITSELNKGYTLQNIKVMSMEKLRKVARFHRCIFKHGKAKKACRDYLALHLLADVNMDSLSIDEIKERMKELNAKSSSKE